MSMIAHRFYTQVIYQLVQIKQQDCQNLNAVWQSSHRELVAIVWTSGEKICQKGNWSFVDTLSHKTMSSFGICDPFLSIV